MRWRVVGILLVGLVVVGVSARLAMPRFVRWYVNRVIDQNPLYDGTIGDVSIHLWRGAYSIDDIRLNKTTGNVPVPFFTAKKLDLAVSWRALRHGKFVARVAVDRPVLNFVDDPDASKSQSGAGGPWMDMLRDLFPFQINRLVLNDGSIHFRTYQKQQPVDVYLSNLQGSVDDLTNVMDRTTPLLSTVKASGLAMDQAKFEFEMKLDPFSYRPTFQMAMRLIGLDVTKINLLTRAYGAFDFEAGWFDLVVEADAKEGQIEGYVKPLFRNIRVIGLTTDLKEDNALELFWEALVGTATGLLKNHPRDQFGTQIPFTGDLTGPQTDLLATVGNVLRNAFVRAYLPQLAGKQRATSEIQFKKGSITEPAAVGAGQ